ncbi:tryptophanyl-tRNA synthetase [Sorangium cellulosum]|uniref:Tryptophan--tRNA ligase n=1 Tax=Sorangium cellulosum TaxID=56 RepID=A0A2L0F3J8_SORCE|nr:tryptophan--tRNA ligase [Sorangium cellulosum]AUX46107.1 tryptophanyl-tRNA synthetase [Sorangium cellulosum]
MSEIRKKRVFSGVQPSGKLHIGNYVGAISLWRELQATADAIFCVVDLHAMTVPEAVKPAELRAKNREIAALYIACGIDPSRTTVFIQSEVTAHAELGWILTCATPLGWLHRMTQFKSKSERQETVGSGLLVYPVLQAADILLYDTDLVPVGEDQKQHIELCRDIGDRFNHLFGETFRLPSPLIRESGARIMGLDAPDQKMSKSTGETVPGHSIGLLDPPGAVKKAIMRAVTDPGQEFRDEHASPGVRNLVTLYEVLSGEPRQAIIDRYQGGGYGYLKKDLVDVVEATLAPIRAEHARLSADPAVLDRLLDEGASRARDLAAPVLARAKRNVGLGRA